MAVITLASASGAPGVTTTAVGLALAWPRPVILLEADPTGGSAVLAGYCRGEVPHDRGLVNLAMAHRAGQDLTQALPGVLMRLPGSAVDLVPGVRSHTQAASTAALWEPLAAALGELDAAGTDVIVDAGRLGLAGAPLPLLRSADVALLVMRTNLPALAGARSWVKALSEEATGAGVSGPGLLLVGEGHPYTGREITGVLGRPVVASLAWDPVSAETFHLGHAPGRRFEHAALARSLRASVSAITAAAGQARSVLTPAGSEQSSGVAR